MKNKILKIIKEELEDFDWTNQIDPLQSFGDYFYDKDGPSKWIGRNIKWWRNWIHEVEMSHATFLDDIEELNDMVHNLVNPVDGSEKYHILSEDVYSFLKPHRALNGRSILQDLASTIYDAYNELGSFAKNNNLTILETLNVFKQWLDKMESEGKSLHKES